MPVLAAAGLLIEAGLAGMVLLGDLRQRTIPFLVLYGLAYLGYAVAVYATLCAGQGRQARRIIWGLAVLFRVTLLLATPPTLSDDVYRYVWDGRLTNSGVNPFAHAVASPVLDQLDSPLRALVNHNWMASPYLPSAQFLFALIYRIAPDSPLAFQVCAVVFDLLTGWMVADLLRRLGLPEVRTLIYLWNPLVVVEFAHGAHVDALMICLIVLALWLLIAFRARLLSAVALAAATLTKGVPLLLLPVVVRRWGWSRTLFYVGLVTAVCVPFALGAGWGLTGPLDGEGVFGAIRIYGTLWRFNGGVYPALEAVLSVFVDPGAVMFLGGGAIYVWAAKAAVGAGLLGILAGVWWTGRQPSDDLTLLRRAVIPLAAYLLLTTTVHPWYVTLLAPLLPFLSLRDEESKAVGVYLLPALYFAAVVPLSYLTYLDPENIRESAIVVLLEYVPTYILLLIACRSAKAGAGRRPQVNS